MGTFLGHDGTRLYLTFLCLCIFRSKTLNIKWVNPIFCWVCTIFSYVYHFPLDTYLLLNNFNCIPTHGLFFHGPQVVDWTPQIKPILYLYWKEIQPNTIFHELPCSQPVILFFQIICIIDNNFALYGFSFFAGLYSLKHSCRYLTGY